MRPGRLSGAGMAIMASPRHDGDVGDAVHPRTARGPAAGPRIADAARYRRDAQGDLAAQAGGKRGAGRAHQRTPRAPPRRHRIPLPHSTQKGFGIDKAVASECDSVKLGKFDRNAGNTSEAKCAVTVTVHLSHLQFSAHLCNKKCTVTVTSARAQRIPVAQAGRLTCPLSSVAVEACEPLE